jgi:hypothetical protein
MRIGPLFVGLIVAGFGSSLIAEPDPAVKTSSKTGQPAEQMPPPVQTTSAPAAAEPPTGPAVDAGENINLICFGAGAANRSTVDQVHGWDSDGNYAHGSVVRRQSQDFGDQVSLRLTGTTGQLRMPRAMLPPLHGGNDGWFQLRNIQYKPNEITASVAVNFMNSPKLRLDRYSGSVSISGKSGDYAGRCEKFDPAQTQRQF